MTGRGSLIAAVALTAASPAGAQAILGSDAAACSSDQGAAVKVEVTGLKDRQGDLKLELYPADEGDFLKDDRDLIAQGKTFRRIRVSAPQSGPVTMCLLAPRPGRYALLFTHNRSGKNKFDFWSDGAGFASNHRIGRARPKLGDALVDIPEGVKTIPIRAQYLRGLGGFGPVGN